MRHAASARIGRPQGGQCPCNINARGKRFFSPVTESESTKTMKFGKHARAAGLALKALGLSLALLMAPQTAMAANPAASATEQGAAEVPVVEEMANAVAGGEAGGDPQAVDPINRMTPVEGKGMPIPGAIGLQDQYSDLGKYGLWVHNAVLLPLITVITLFVLGLLLWVIARYNRRSNPVASKTSHNTVIEVVWTLVPVLILVGIAVPSIDLLAKQYKPAPAEAITIKATGNQWYWTYSYPDNGEFEIVSNMLNLPGQPIINNGIREAGSDVSDGPEQFEVDNRLVVPAGEPIRMQITAADVIHSFAVPSLWFKIDAVPGRINEKVMTINEPGVYYGQCSELCGPKHGYMPIAIEALPRDEFDAWVKAQPGICRSPSGIAARRRSPAASLKARKKPELPPPVPIARLMTPTLQTPKHKPEARTGFKRSWLQPPQKVSPLIQTIMGTRIMNTNRHFLPGGSCLPTIRISVRST